MSFSLTKLLGEPRKSGGPTCEICASPLEDRHGHAVDTADRRLLCTCYACTLLFAAPGAARGRFKIVPKRYEPVPSPLFSDAQWDALGIPIGLAFFFENSVDNRVTAFYPGPAGATESQLPLQAWQELRAREPLIDSMLPDVEAALVYRPRGRESQSYIAPIDACYELVGLIRSTWKGLDGGDAVQNAVEGFFQRLASLAEGTIEGGV